MCCSLSWRLCKDHLGFKVMQVSYFSLKVKYSYKEVVLVLGKKICTLFTKLKTVTLGRYNV